MLFSISVKPPKKAKKKKIVSIFFNLKRGDFAFGQGEEFLASFVLLFRLDLHGMMLLLRVFVLVRAMSKGLGGGRRRGGV